MHDNVFQMLDNVFHRCVVTINYLPLVAALNCGGEVLAKGINNCVPSFTGVLGANQGRKNWAEFNTSHGAQVCPFCRVWSLILQTTFC